VRGARRKSGHGIERSGSRVKLHGYRDGLDTNAPLTSNLNRAGRDAGPDQYLVAAGLRARHFTCLKAHRHETVIRATVRHDAW